MRKASMRPFALDETSIRDILNEAQRLASRSALPDASDGELSITQMAALLYSQHDAEALRAAAVDLRGARAYELETFSPLYLTNTCDSECKMCGMRRDNRELDRQTAALPEIQRQLEILTRRGVFAV